MEVAPGVALWTLLRRLAPELRPYRAALVVLALVTAAIPAVEAAEIWLFQRVIDDVLVPAALQPLLWIALLYVGLSLASGLLGWVDQVLSTWIGERLSLTVRQRMLARLHDASTEVVDRARLGDLLTRLTSDVRAVETLLVAGVVDGVGALARLIFFAGALLVLDWQLALISFVVTPLLWGSGRRFARRMKHVSKETRRRAGSMAAVAEESVGALALVQVHGRAREEQARFEREGRAILAAQMAAARLRAAYPIVVDLLELAGLLLAIGLGTWALAEGRLTLGELLVFLTYLSQLYRPIRAISDLAADLASATAGVERVLEVLDLPVGVRERPEARSLPHATGIVEVDGVSYTYEGADRVAVQEVGFVLRPGRLTVLTGPSGSGKSTLVRLVARLADPTIGAVRLDGWDLRDLTLETVRSNIAVLLQDATVLDASVRDNVTFARPGASDDDVWQALAAAEVADVVAALPDGLDTRLRQRGRVLSGGQRQRIALARALLVDAPVLVLDEPTTGLDVATARRLMSTLRRLAAERAILVASHDSSVREVANDEVKLASSDRHHRVPWTDRPPDVPAVVGMREPTP